MIQIYLLYVLQLTGYYFFDKFLSSASTVYLMCISTSLAQYVVIDHTQSDPSTNFDNEQFHLICLRGTPVTLTPYNPPEMLQQLFVSSSHYRSEECNYINVATFKKHSLILCIQVKKPKIYLFSTSISHFCTLHIGTVTNFQHFCSPGTLSIKNALCIRYG